MNYSEGNILRWMCRRKTVTVLGRETRYPAYCLLQLCKMVVRRAGTDVNGTLKNTSSQLLAYVGDIAILGRSFVRIQEVLLKLEALTKCLGLKINKGKTKCVIVSGSQSCRSRYGQ